MRVKARVLSSEEAIGNPEADDFPLQKGKERLMQAEFSTGTGQAFTDRYRDFSGKLCDIIEMPLKNNFRRAVFVAALNAVLRHLNEVHGTIHCRDKEPALCANDFLSHKQVLFCGTTIAGAAHLLGWDRFCAKGT